MGRGHICAYMTGEGGQTNASRAQTQTEQHRKNREGYATLTIALEEHRRSPLLIVRHKTRSYLEWGRCPGKMIDTEVRPANINHVYCSFFAKVGQ